MTHRAVIFGCEGLEATPWEKSFFAATDPLGFILFTRNCDSPEQVRALVASLRESVGREDAPVLIDQEGGRVQRLKPPHWRDVPAGRRLILKAPGGGGIGPASERPLKARQADRLAGYTSEDIE